MVFHCYSNAIQHMTIHVLETMPQPYPLRALNGSVCGSGGGSSEPRVSRKIIDRFRWDKWHSIHLVVGYPLNHQNGMTNMFLKYILLGVLPDESLSLNL